MDEPQAHHDVQIFIDGIPCEAPTARITADGLRRLAQPPLPADRKMWLDVPDAPDKHLTEEDSVELVPGMRFFSQPRKIYIFIDRTRYEVTRARMTGAELRNVPQPPVAPDRELWLDRLDEQDKKIADDKTVHLDEGMRFFTAPGRINPGSR